MSEQGPWWKWRSVGVLTWTFRILLVGALAVLAFSCEASELDLPMEESLFENSLATVVHRQAYTSYDFSVLTFNVAGLPWPISSGRAEMMTAIGRSIKALSGSGNSVDIVLIQEGFIPETEDIAAALEFSETVTGPGSNLETFEYRCIGCGDAIPPRKWSKGEGVGAWLGSGLHVLSAHPIVGVRRMAFGSKACAGYDCLANKGAVLARIALPGAPEPLEVITTHLNSTNAAGVPREETHIAHQRQVRLLADFWNRAPHTNAPVIAGGDFNIRGSHQRFVPLAKLFKGATFVKNTCRAVGGLTPCDIDVMPDAPWLTSQDLQVFRSGTAMRLTPISARTVFDKPVDGKQLSDHFGFLVRYRVSWPSNDVDKQNVIGLAKTN